MKFLKIAVAAALLLAMALPVSAVRYRGDPLPAGFEPLNNALNAAVSSGDHARIASSARALIEFWLAGQTVEARSQKWGANARAHGRQIASVYLAARYMRIALEPVMLERPAVLAYRDDFAWSLKVTLAFIDAYQELMALGYPYGPRTGNPVGLDWTRTRVRHQLEAMTVEPLVFAELWDGMGRIVYHGALHEPRTGAIFGETAGGMVTDGEKMPGGLMIYVQYEYETIESRMEADLRRVRDAGIDPQDYALIQIGWNFIGEGASLARVPSDGVMITAAARYLAGTGLPVLLRVGAEMNVWERRADPAEFITAFRFIANIMRREAPNVAMLWSVNSTSAEGLTWEMFYPGEAYVDWVGTTLYTDRYFLGNPRATAIDQAVFRRGAYANPVNVVRDIVAAFGDRHPIIITEGAVALLNVPNNEDLTEWALPFIRRKYTYVPMMFPEVKAMFWFNVNPPNPEPQRYDFASVADPRAHELYAQLTDHAYFIGLGQRYSPVTYRQLGTANMPADNVALFTYAHFFAVDNLRVEYRIDGEWAGSSTVIPYWANLDLSGRPDGVHTLSVLISCGDTRAHLKTLSFNLEKRGGRAVISDRPITGADFVYVPVVPREIEAAPPDISVYVNGEAVIFDQPPVIIGGRTMVPVRATLEALGATVGWEPASQTVTAERGGVSISLQIGSDLLTRNGESIIIDAPAQIIGGRTLVPIRHVAESFGATVDWDGETRTVTIDTA